MDKLVYVLNHKKDLWITYRHRQKRVVLWLPEGKTYEDCNLLVVGLEWGDMKDEPNRIYYLDDNTECEIQNMCARYRYGWLNTKDGYLPISKDPMLYLDKFMKQYEVIPN